MTVGIPLRNQLVQMYRTYVSISMNSHLMETIAAGTYSMSGEKLLKSHTWLSRSFEENSSDLRGFFTLFIFIHTKSFQLFSLRLQPSKRIKFGMNYYYPLGIF